LSGGLRTVVYSDVALFIIMCLGVSSVLVFSVMQFGGLSFLQANLPPSYFSPCDTNSIPTTLVWFILACSTTFISPAFYQRCLAAFDDRTAIKGILISTAIWFIFDVCTTFGAMYAKAVIPEADSLYAYITYGVQLLPAGFRGLLLASIAAAIIATLDSFLFIASNILFYDLPILKLQTLKIRQFAALIVTAILTVLLAVCFNGRIETVWLVLKSYFTACLLLPILFGYYFPRLANDKLFVINAIVSCISITVSHVFFRETQLIDSFYVGCLASCAVFGVYYIGICSVTLKSIYERTQNSTWNA
jgi:solute:Na+ symporter, SSS family